MVQVTSETMKKIRSAMKEMQDLVTPAGEAAEGSNEVHKMKIIWGSSDDSSSRFVGLNMILFWPDLLKNLLIEHLNS